MAALKISKITKEGKVVVYQVKILYVHKKHKRWLASDMNFKQLQTGCPIAHGHMT